eukprot:8360613-Alexandrium_andersonii.AAC.1
MEVHQFRAVADLLRELAQACDLGSAEGRTKHAQVEGFVAQLEFMASQCSALAFQKSIREIRHHAAVPRPGKGAPYRLAFLVKAMLLADVLRS